MPMKKMIAFVRKQKDHTLNFLRKIRLYMKALLGYNWPKLSCPNDKP